MRNKIKAFNKRFPSNQENNKGMSGNKQNDSSETYSSVFNLNDLPVETRNTTFHFYSYNYRDGEWIEKWALHSID